MIRSTLKPTKMKRTPRLVSLLGMTLPLFILGCGAGDNSNGGSDEKPDPAPAEVGFIVSAISGNTTEASSTASFNVQLISQPSAVVEISVSSLDLSEGLISPETLTFTPDNWNATDHSVTVTGVDDDLQDGDQTFTIELGKASSTDPEYNDLKPADVSVVNVDNDTAGISLTAISGNTAEDGTQATFSVKLNSEPAADVVIAVTSSNLEEATVSPSTLTFTSENWNAADHVITVSGVNDDVADGAQDYAIVLGAAASDDQNYNAFEVAAAAGINSDNDSAGFSISAISGHTAEGGSQATFAVKLNSEPTANVVISVNSSNENEGTVSATNLTFTSENWNAADHTITVSGVNDDVADGGQAYSVVLGGVVSDDENYNGLVPSDVAVINDDNDSAGFTVSAISGNTAEDGTTATFSVQLNSQPTADVVIALRSSNENEGTVSASSLTFTADNWKAENHIITVTGVNDFKADGNQSFSIILDAATSDDENYNLLNALDVAVINVDNNSAGFVISAIDGETSEAGVQATFSVKLTSEPEADVVISITSSNEAEGLVSASALTFTPGDWNDNDHIITVTGVNDDIADGSQQYLIALGEAVSSDAGYEGLKPTDVAVVNTDNDSSGFTISAISGNTSEDATAATFNVQLTSEPIADVVIAVSSSNENEGTVSIASLILTSTNWNSLENIVTVTGVDDSLLDGNQSYSIILGAAVSDDDNYNAIDVTDVAVVNMDDDSAGITVKSVEGVISETGSSAVYTIQLSTPPTEDVTIAVTSSNTDEGTIDVSSLTFSSSDWNDDSHVVTVTGVDDAAIDGNQSFKIEFGIAVTTDADYVGVKPADMNVVNIDDDGHSIIGGMMWLDNNIPTYHYAVNAPAFCATLGLSGYSDWRIPTLGELNVLYANRASLNSYVSVGREPTWYLTSTPHLSKYFRGVMFSNGQTISIASRYKTVVRCVRNVE